MRKRPLLWQFFIAFSAISVAAMLLASWYAARIARDLYLDEVSAELERCARLVDQRVLANGLSEGTDGVQARCKDLAKLLAMRITVIGASGQVLADSEEDPRHMDNHLDRPEVAAAAEGDVGRATRYSDTLKEERMYIAVPIYRGEKLAAVGRASVAVGSLASTLHAMYRRLALGATILAGIVALASLWSARRILRPLEHIRAGAERFARGELQHRVRIADATEMAMLAESLNQMAQQLDERIRAAVHQKNEREAILFSMEEGVLAVDNAGTILDLNGAAARMLGLDRDAACGRLVWEVVRKQELLQFLDTVLSSGNPVDDDLQLLGETDRWFHARGTSLHDADDQNIGALVVLHDVTRLRHLENVRRDFVANVSHELKTPITSIKGFVETLLEESLENKESALHFLQIILRQANRLDAIIEDLLALSRIERGAEAKTIHLEDSSITDVLRNAVEVCQRKADDKQVRLATIVPADLTVRVNPGLLEHAVVNLVDNAVKYSGAGTTVTIETHSDHTCLVLCVKDQGCGIAPQHLPRLFERFYRVDKARSRELGGTGLGLAIVKHIVAAHRGTVSVESAVGRGSVFTIRLPDVILGPAAAVPTSAAE